MGSAVAQSSPPRRGLTTVRVAVRCVASGTHVHVSVDWVNRAAMNIVVLYNPIAGAGKAGAVARRIGEAVDQAGRHVVLAETRIDAADDWLDRQLAEAGALVVVGGDGAVRLAAEPAIRTQTPLYHFPSGTENLFSREFGMDRRVQTLLRALERNEPRLVDVGVVNGRTFLLMVSVGYDAEVVHDLAGRRGSSISHWSYLGPSIRQLRSWRPSRLAVTVDGERIDLGRQGAVVVANSRQYAWRLDPAQRAVMSDGLLDVLFFRWRPKPSLWHGSSSAGCGDIWLIGDLSTNGVA